MSDDLVSIVLTSRNHGQWLQQSIESVLAQTYGNWELIIVDNCSTDHSPQVLEQYQKHPRITVMLYAQHMPLTALMNRAIKVARGRYFSILCSDDYYLPQKLERQVATFEELPAGYGVVYSPGYRLMLDGQLHLTPCGLHQGNVLQALLTEPQFFAQIGPLALRECVVRYPFDETIFQEGEGIYAKIALGYLFHPLPEPLVVMRDHPRNMGKEIGANLQRDILMYEHLFGRADFPEADRHLKGIALGNTYRLAGWQAIRRERKYRQGREWLQLAVKNDPKTMRNLRVLSGLFIGFLPKLLADASMDLLDHLMGAPPPPVDRPETPVEGFPVADHSTGTDR